MEDLGASTAWGLVVAATLVAGAVLAAVADLPARVAATVTAFGGGTLLAAVAPAAGPGRGPQAGPCSPARDCWPGPWSMWAPTRGSPATRA